MSSSNEGELVTLDVRTGDEAAEIFVIDGRFSLAGRGLGTRQTFDLEPGIYKVKVCVGTEVREEQVLLRPGGGPVTQAFPRLAFASPVPLPDTAKTDEFHLMAAVGHSRTVHVTAGRGSWVFVCVRGPTEGTRPAPPAGDRPHPAVGLKLLDESGSLVADLEAGSAKDLDREPPWAACNVAVDPGNYRLLLEVPTLGRTLEQAVAAPSNWQTQIFLVQRDYAGDAQGSRGGADLRADLSGASVLMSGPAGGDDPQPPGFEPESGDLRLVELARLALDNQRKILSGELRQLLKNKFQNPMLGIFGAHLLLLEREFDKDLFGTVVGNLRRMVGREHMDVEALALKLDEPVDLTFRFPPMLQRSWSLICAATADKPEFVPADSFLSEVSESWWSSSLWLTWLGRPPWEAAAVSDEPSDFDEAVKLILKAAGRRPQGGLKDHAAAGVYFLGALWRWLHSVLTRSGPSADLLSTLKELTSDDEAVRKLTLRLGLPRASVEKYLKEFERKVTGKKL